MYGKTCNRLKNKRRLFMSEKYIKKKEKKFKKRNKRSRILPKNFILKTFDNFF